MKTSKPSLYEAVLARISLGAVPIDGIYWFDPKAAGRADVSKQSKPAGRQSGDAKSS
jgi:hypothetical protein